MVNIYDIYLNICFLYSLYKLVYNESDENIKNVKKYAISCGPIAIKCIQFLYMNYIIKSNTLKVFLENCPIHSIEDTQKIYFQDFGTHIENDYILHEIIGSGSIGQVYRALF